ncbi:hypothetical protein GH714_012253 [Hevea brasiliensis]|uniref:Retrovirus-related Pol polyprotein from transposon TNT 1-94-like beta-barrel domain-containing protein n=1 Tax=Hevea brasiliensis TaxID=3981 RepID=A0A6A6NGQ6_HEVBR|nr:hypothetical protein GH714_012253 [Hevea brasiliensis]
MKKDETINNYFARVMMVANKMRSNGEDMSDTKIVEKILRTLTEKFTYVCVSIEESKDIETMSVDELQSSLVVHEQKFRRARNDDEDQGICYTVNDVYLVPELKNNLLSVGQLQEKGVAILFKDGVCSLYHPQKGKMAESVMSANRMFILLAEPFTAVTDEKCLQIGSTDQLILWHHRYGHLSYKACTLWNIKTWYLACLELSCQVLLAKLV